MHVVYLGAAFQKSELTRQTVWNVSKLQAVSLLHTINDSHAKGRSYYKTCSKNYCIIAIILPKVKQFVLKLCRVSRLIKTDTSLKKHSMHFSRIQNKALLKQHIVSADLDTWIIIFVRTCILPCYRVRRRYNG